MFDRNKKAIIDYAPEALKTFEVIAYEWIDNLNFTLQPAECLDNAQEYVTIANDIFLEHGWDGDGAIELMWIPPFMFDPIRQPNFTMGVTVWHVKQLEDGLSWILHPAGMFQNLAKM